MSVHDLGCSNFLRTDHWACGWVDTVRCCRLRTVYKWNCQRATEQAEFRLVLAINKAG